MSIWFKQSGAKAESSVRIDGKQRQLVHMTKWKFVTVPCARGVARHGKVLL